MINNHEHLDITIFMSLPFKIKEERMLSSDIAHL